MSCPDQKGIVAKVSAAMVELDANILQNFQVSDPATQTFCMRTRFEVPIFEIDLLYRRENGELPVDIPIVVSNHPDLRDIERLVLSRAVTAQAEDRIFLLDDRTVVFD